MTARISRLLVILAVLLMPFGMVTAASAGPHATSMPMGHCLDAGQQHDNDGGFVECAMACSAALPAVDVADPDPLAAVCSPQPARMVKHFYGLHPKTATPPPKRS